MNPEYNTASSRQPGQPSSNPLAVSSGISKYTAIEEVNIQFRRGNIAEAREKSELLISDYLEGNRAVDPELLLAVRLYTRCNRLLGKQLDSVGLVTQTGSLVKNQLNDSGPVQSILSSTMAIGLGRAMIEAGGELAQEGVSWLAGITSALDKEPLASVKPDLRGALAAEIALGLGTDALNRGHGIKAKETLSRAEALFHDLSSGGPEMKLFRCEALDSLARIEIARGDTVTAYKLAYESYEQKMSLLDGNHPEVIFSLQLIGGIERTLGQFKEARESLTVAHKLCEERLPERQDLIDSLECSILQTRFFMSKGEERDQLVQEINDLMTAIEERGSYRYQEIDSYLWAAVSVIIEGEFVAGGKESLERIDEVLNNRYGPDHFFRALSSVAIGDIYHKKEDLLTAEAYFEDAFTIQRKSLGEDSHMIASLLKRLVRVSVNQADVSKAHRWAETLNELCPHDHESKPILEEIAKYLDRDSGEDFNRDDEE